MCSRVIADFDVLHGVRPVRAMRNTTSILCTLLFNIASRDDVLGDVILRQLEHLSSGIYCRTRSDTRLRPRHVRLSFG